MAVNVWLFRVYSFLLLTFLFHFTVDSAILRGPENIVGIFHKSATLNCHSHASERVTWTFVPMGRTDDDFINESEFPFHYNKWRSSRGDHQLTLESLTFKNVGRYVCRLEGPSSNGLDAAESFVVVVADPPSCKSNSAGKQLTYNDSVNMECSITFMGQHNLTLEWLAPDGSVLETGNFWSDNKGHVARLPLIVRVQTLSRYNVLTPEYMCRASFSNRTTNFADEASNSPEFQGNTCVVGLPAPTVSSTVASTYAQTSPATTNADLAVWLLAAALVVTVIALIVLICLYLNRAKIAAIRRKRTERDGEPPNNPEQTSSNPPDTERCEIQQEAAARGAEAMPLIQTRENDSSKRPDGLPEPVSRTASVQEGADSISPGKETTATDLSDSVNSAVTSPTGYEDMDIALHEDPINPDQSGNMPSEQPIEADTEDQVGSTRTPRQF